MVGAAIDVENAADDDEDEEWEDCSDTDGDED
jgi:hypothetical protein